MMAFTVMCNSECWDVIREATRRGHENTQVETDIEMGL